MPKKDNLRIVKWYVNILYFLSIFHNLYCSHDHIEIIVNTAGDLLFFRQREGLWMPTLRLFHKCMLIFYIRLCIKCNWFADPFFLPMQQVDKGAIRFVLSGANIMCPGLTSPGAKMTDVPKGTIVVNIKFIPCYIYYK